MIDGILQIPPHLVAALSHDKRSPQLGLAPGPLRNRARLELLAQDLSLGDFQIDSLDWQRSHR